MPVPDMSTLRPWLEYLSGLSTLAIAGAAAAHLLVFLLLLTWYRSDLRAIAGCLDDFTRDLNYRSVLGRSAPLTNQIDAFVQDINDVLADPNRREDRVRCLQRIHILDEKRSYLDSLSFETIGNMARTMIEAYPLAGVLGTILAIGSALQAGDAAQGADAAQAATATMAGIVSRFGDAIWSTFAGLLAAMLLMFVNSILEPRFSRLTDCRVHVRDMVARAKRELGLATVLRSEPAVAEVPSA